MEKKIDGYEDHYLKIDKTYPSVVALKFFLGNNPDFSLRNICKPGHRVLDIGFGDGRDLNLFLDLGFKVYGVEPNEKVVQHTVNKLKHQTNKPDLRVGNNMNTTFDDNSFDVVYSSGAIYYLPSQDHTILDALQESYRVLKKSGYFVGSLCRSDSHAVHGAIKLNNNVFILEDPFYKFRKGQVYHTYNNHSEIINDFSKIGFSEIKIYDYDVDWFGTRETLFLFVAKK